jgi:hypothetical protein
MALSLPAHARHHLQLIDGACRPTCRCPGGIGLGADPCDPNPCFNGGRCATRGAPGGGHRRAQAGMPFTCTCRAGFSGMNCELQDTAGVVGGCEPRLPSIPNTLIHMMDPGIWKRMFAAIASLADELHNVDWSLSGMVSGCSVEEIVCADQSEDQCYQLGQWCYWSDPASFEEYTGCVFNEDPEASYDAFCPGETVFTQEELIDVETSDEIDEVLLAIRDAISVLADQLPDSDASVHLPPAVLDFDEWILRTLEGDWHTVFDQISTFFGTFSHIDWGSVHTAAMDDHTPCDSECEQAQYIFDIISRFTRKMADAIPQHAPAPPPADNWCKVSMLDIPALLMANFDIASFKQTVQTIHDVTDAARMVEWTLYVTNPDSGELEPVIDPDASAEFQQLLSTATRTTAIILQEMPDVQARRPSTQTLGDVWDWLIDFIGSDWEGIGGSCETIAHSLGQVDWAALIQELNAEDEDPMSDDDAQEFQTLANTFLGMGEAFCQKLSVDWPPRPPPDGVCKTWLFSFQDFWFGEQAP